MSGQLYHVGDIVEHKVSKDSGIVLGPVVAIVRYIGLGGVCMEVTAKPSDDLTHWTGQYTVSWGPGDQSHEHEMVLSKKV